MHSKINTPFFSKLKNSISQDFRDFKAQFSTQLLLEHGLHTYRIKRSDGSVMRVHLRVENGGSGVLFIDVTDVIHLNPTGVEISKLLLDGVSVTGVKTLLRKKYSLDFKEQIEVDIEKIYQVVDHFHNHNGDCFTCAFTGLLEMAPLFSLPISAPYKVDIALTYGCNNECPHCYNEIGRLPMPSLVLENWYKVLDKVSDLGIPHVILTGGEATLHPNLPEIIQYADELGMIVGLNTNGRHISHKLYMQKLAAVGLNHIQITLGSNYSEVHNAFMGGDSFSQTVKGIENAMDSGVHVITNTTLMRSNMDHAEEIIDFIHDFGINTFAMNGMIYSGGGFAHPNAISEEEFPTLLVRVRDHAESLGMKFLWYTPTEYCRLSPVELEIGTKRCNAGEYSICIEPNGDILPCQSYYVSAGNILRDPWEEIWDSELLESFRNREEEYLKDLPKKCWDCIDLPVCGGGCRIEREARDGVRVAEIAGGGCVGCSGFAGTVSKSAITDHHIVPKKDLEYGGFVPTASQVKTTRRSSGKMPLINIKVNKK